MVHTKLKELVCRSVLAPLGTLDQAKYSDIQHCIMQLIMLKHVTHIEWSVVFQHTEERKTDCDVYKSSLP